MRWSLDTDCILQRNVRIFFSRACVQGLIDCRWRRMRKASHEALSKVVSHGLDDYQLEEAVVLARNGLQDVAGWFMHVRSATVSTMLRSMYDESPVCQHEIIPAHILVNEAVAVQRARCSCPAHLRVLCAHGFRFFSGSILGT